MRGTRLSEITWEEAKELTTADRVVVLPISGGAKEHGPQLPCGTDQMVIDALAGYVVKACDVLLLPTLAYAYYPAFVDWPGSVSIEAVNFINVVNDIVTSLYRHGARKFLLLDGGVSTQFPLRIVSSDLHNRLGVQVAVTNISNLGKEVRDAICEQESGGHADESETSCMLYIRPDLVKLDRAQEEYRKSMPGTISADGSVKVAIGGKMNTVTGVNGNPTLASAEKGRVIVEAMASDVVDFLKHFASEVAGKACT